MLSRRAHTAVRLCRLPVTARHSHRLLGGVTEVCRGACGTAPTPKGTGSRKEGAHVCAPRGGLSEPIESESGDSSDPMTRRAAKAQPEPPASPEVDIEALLREAEAAEAAARATLPTPEEERVIIAAAEALAGYSSRDGA